MDIENMERLARQIRITSLKMIKRGKSSHIGSNFSMVEIMVALYSEILNISPSTLKDPDRDRLILSKGHAAASYYAILAEFGFLSKELLEKFYVDGGELAGHVTKGVPGVEASTGSLGHGLSIGAGMALAAKLDNRKYRVFTILSDGECNEGSIWEAAMFAAHHKLDNLIAVVDYNKIQALGFTEEVLSLEPFKDKWASFGWSVEEIDGHDLKAILRVLGRVPLNEKKPTCVIAHTVKGKGVSFMENELLWHYRNPDDQEFKKALDELEVN